MIGFTIASGWIMAFLLLVVSLLPWLVRRNYRGAFKSHFAIGLAIPMLAIIHATAAMGGGWAGDVNETGLWLAMVAWFVAVAQAGLGLALRDGLAHRPWRRVHLGGMALLAACAVAHVALNSVFFA